MRPVAVLALILGAIAALTFAIFSLGPSDRPDGVRGPVDAAAPSPGPDASAELRAAGLVDPAPPTGVDGRERTEAGEDIAPAWRNLLVVRVVGQDGQPLSDAKVHLMRDGGAPQLSALHILFQGKTPERPVRSLETGADGEVTFRSLRPAKAWGLVVEHERYSRKQVDGVRLPEQGTLEERVQLEPGFGLFGYVRDQDTTAPIAGATLVLEDPLMTVLPAGRRSASRIETQSREDGRYEFANVSAGQRSLWCMAPGYGTQIQGPLTFGARGERVQEKSIALRPGLIVAGRVVGSDGTGIVGAELDAICHATDFASRGRAVTKADGQFVIKGLGAGTYTLNVVAPGWDSQPEQVRAGDTDVVIVLAKQGAVLGHVIDAGTGRPIESFSCTVRRLHPTSRAHGLGVATESFRGRADGAFEIAGLSPETYVVQADARGFATSFSEPFTILSGLKTPDVLIRMTKGGSLTGRVLDARTGEGIPGATVRTNDNNYIESEFIRVLEKLSGPTVRHQTLKTDADGRFEMTLMAPGTYQLVVGHPDYSRRVRNDIVVAGSTPTNVDPFVMERGATVRGTVYTAQGTPAAGAQVTLTRAEVTRSQQPITARTDAQGRFVLSNAPQGVYKLAAARAQVGPGANPFEPFIDMRNSEVEMTLLEGQEYAQDLSLVSSRN